MSELQDPESSFTKSCDPSDTNGLVNMALVSHIELVEMQNARLQSEL